jgi:hypothetical protein
VVKIRESTSLELSNRRFRRLRNNKPAAPRAHVPQSATDGVGELEYG